MSNRVNAMRGLRPLRKETFLVASVIIVMLSLLAGGLYTYATMPSSHTAPDHLYLTIGFNFNTGMDEYFPANFTIIAGVRTIITITNYDNGTNPVPDQIAVPMGVSSLSYSGMVAPANGREVSHTFTVPTLGISVPIPAANGQTPSVVTFTILMKNPGTYAWHCMAPCDPTAMETPGFMTGYVSVTS